VTSPHVDADAGFDGDFPAGFLQRLARDRLQQRLARFEMAGRLVQSQAVAGGFPDQQEAAITLDHGGYGGVRFPAGHRMSLWSSYVI